MVSVVVTVRNEEKSIEKLLRALISQNKKPDEIILVDGGSTDTTVVKIQKLKIKHQRCLQLRIKNQNDNLKFKIFVKAGNRAVGRNYGISRARNEIIAVTDAGGYPRKDWLKKITTPFVEKETDVVSGYYKSLARTPFGKCVTPYFLVMPDKVKRGMEFLPSSRSVAFRKSIWKKAGGYPEQFSHNEDFVFDHNLKKADARFFFEPRAVVYWSPPKNLLEAAKKFFRFALGDAEAGIERPKIKLIFARYILGLTLLLFKYYNVLLFCVLLYFLWSLSKNFRYARVWQSVFWLTLIQIVADSSVMSGFLAGSVTRNSLTRD